MPTSDPTGGGARRDAPGFDGRHGARAAWTWILLPVLALAGAMLIAIALVEGPPLENFLYAVF